MPKAKKADATSNETGIVVTAQQSRFHADAIDAPDSKEIDIKNLSVSVAGVDLIDASNLRIREGVHYVLAGRNGTGKSTLLKAIAQGLVPGIPSNMRILLLGQTSLEGLDVEAVSQDRAGGSTETVLQYVLRSDKIRQGHLKEANVLSNALSDSSDAIGTVRASRQVLLERAERDFHVKKLIAARRSGARGLRARKAQIEAEELVSQRRKLLDECGPGVPPDVIEQEISKAVAMLDELQLTLEATSASTAETQARNILRGLGFSELAVDGSFEALSGGWRTRCELACAITQKCDVLLLDEPTNFLDLPSIIWLETFISTRLDDTSVVVVTHDRTFADNVGTQLILLRLNPARKLETFNGTLSEYEAERRKQIRRMTRMKEANNRKAKHIEETISGNLKAAKRTGDDKKLKQVASRKKKLDDRMGMEVGLHGGRFKLNRDLPGYHLKRRADIEIPGLDPIVNLSLPEGPGEMRYPGSLVSFENVSFRYSKTTDLVLKNVTFNLQAGDRVGIVGLNGAGKSTIIKLLVSSFEAAASTGTSSGGLKNSVTKGQIALHPRLRLGHFSQHAVEELTALGASEPSLTSLEYFQTRFPGVYTEQELRALLSGLGLRGTIVSNTPIAALSGGQKVRLALADCVHDSPDLLVLDEVSMHLDADSVTALAKAVSPKNWDGALIIVSHDRYFVKRVVEGWSGKGDLVGEGSDEPDDEGSSSEDDDDGKPGTVYRMRKGELVKLEGGMDDYERIAAKSASKWTK